MLMGADIHAAAVDPTKWSAVVSRIGDPSNNQVEVFILLANNTQVNIPLTVKLPLGIDDPQGYLEAEVAKFVANSDNSKQTNLKITKGLDLTVKSIVVPPTPVVVPLTLQELDFLDKYSKYKRYNLVAPSTYNKAAALADLQDILNKNPTFERLLL